MIFRLVLALFLLLPHNLIAQEVTPDHNLTNETQRELVRVLKVSDGDSIRVRLNGKSTAIRLTGIDAPELSNNQKAKRDAKELGISEKELNNFGRIALAGMNKLVRDGDLVSLEFDQLRSDKYGRTLAYVFLEDGTLLQLKLLEQGLVRPLPIPPNTRYASVFHNAYKNALNQSKGIYFHDSIMRNWLVKEPSSKKKNRL